MRVLVVEDSKVGRLLRLVLERDGHEPILVTAGEEGWRRLIGDDPPQLVILDRMLPDMDGTELLRRLRADERTARLPVLVLNAALGKSRDLDDGVLTRVLGKPFDLPELREVLCALAGR